MKLANTNNQTRFAFLSQIWPEDDNAPFSGSSVQVYFVAKELASRGYPVMVILSSHDNYFVAGENITVVSVDGYQGLRNLLGRGFRTKVIKLLQDFKPDYIYQRGKLPESVIAEKYCRTTDCKFIWLSNADTSGDRWKFVKKRWAKRDKYPVTLIPRLIEAFYADILIEAAIKKSDIAIAQTKYQQVQLLNNFNIKSAILGSGHTITSFLKSYSEVPNVLWLANLTPMKQPQLFAKLAAELKQVKANFIMAGKALNKDIINEVHNIARNCNNFKYISNIGIESGNKLFQSADLFISTSISRFEGLPNTFIQALVNGTPIISLNVDPDGIIENNGLGEVVHSFEELKIVVESWVMNKEKRIKASENAFKFGRENFNIVDIVDRLLAIISG